MNNREISVGDIHGCFKELKSLLKTIGPIKSDDKLIFIGDYIDRGSASYEVFCYIKKFKEKYGKKIILLRGNHEDMMFDYFGLPASQRYDEGIWLDLNGGGATLKSFQSCKEDIEKAANWLAKNTQLIFETNKAVYVHAGLYIGEKTPIPEMLWMRDELFLQGKQPKLLIIGHSPVEAPLFLKDFNIVNIDNGCVYGQGPLLGYDVINKIIYSSDGKIKPFKI